MTFNADKIFLQGSTHTVCQDYALAGLKSYNEDNDAAWALIADGCSGSPNVDFGARVVAKSAENRLKYFLPDELPFRKKLISSIDAHCADLELNEDSLNATLLFLQSIKNEYEVRAYGDGAIVKLQHDGNIDLTIIEYSSGAPLYLSYYIDDAQFERYRDQYGLQRKIFKYLITPNDETLTVALDETGLPYIEKGITDNYKAITVTSDGISSFARFVNKLPAYIDPVFIARHIMYFKSIKGKFIERRINAFKDYCDKNGIKHTDDFSMAGISFER